MTTAAGDCLSILKKSEDLERSIDELIAAEGLVAVHGLAKSWGASSDLDERRIALAVLADLAVPDLPASVGTILEQTRGLHRSDDEPLRWRAAAALWAVANALPGVATGIAQDVRADALDALVSFAADESQEVRLQVAFGLDGLLSQEAPATDPGVRTLVRLCSDEDPDVQDWATFALTGLKVDSPGIRDALLDVARGAAAGPAAAQAAEALAGRGDRRVLPVLMHALTRDDVADTWVRTAAKLPDPVLAPALERLASTGWADRGASGRERTSMEHVLAAAIAAVGGSGPRL